MKGTHKYTEVYMILSTITDVFLNQNMMPELKTFKKMAQDRD